MIELTDVTRDFKVLRREEGIRGAYKSLFSRDYQYIQAVRHLDVNISKGEIVGFLGPNGAGKSTTIKMMTGLLKPTSGTILVGGLNPFEHRNQYLKKIGVVFGQRSQLWWTLPLIESFRILKEIYGIDDKVYQENIAMYQEIIGIDELYHKPVRQMSLGQRTLCDILASFLHNPNVIFLDEPTIGIDVATKEKIYQLILTLNKQKKTTIVLTSHDMEDIDFLCKRILIVDKGIKILDDDIQNVKECYGKNRILNIKVPESARKMIEHSGYLLEFCGQEAVEYVGCDNSGWIAFKVNEEQVLVKDLIQRFIAEIELLDIKIEDESTEDIIKKIYASQKES